MTFAIDGLNENILHQTRFFLGRKKIISMIEKRVLFYRNNPSLLPRKPRYSFANLKEDLKGIHKRFVLTPADKASNNVIVI